MNVTYDIETVKYICVKYFRSFVLVVLNFMVFPRGRLIHKDFQYSKKQKNFQQEQTDKHRDMKKLRAQNNVGTVARVISYARAMSF